MSEAKMVALALVGLSACLCGALGLSYPLPAQPYHYPLPQPYPYSLGQPQWPAYYPYYPHPAYPAATVKPPPRRSPQRLPVVDFHKGDVIDYEYIYDTLPVDYEKKIIILKVDNKKPTTARSVTTSPEPIPEPWTEAASEGPQTEEPYTPPAEPSTEESPDYEATSEQQPEFPPEEGLRESSPSPPVFRPPSWETDDPETTAPSEYEEYPDSYDENTEDAFDATTD